MRFGRRPFLRFALGLAALSAQIRGAFAGPIGPAERTAYPLTAFAPYLDTLIPADEGTGSASKAGVVDRLRDKARRDRKYMHMVRWGCRWLDTAARRQGAGDFAGLDPGGRESVVARAAAARVGSKVRVFFDQTRLDAMTAYYTQSEVVSSLGYNGPPQPNGFADHAQAPR